MESHTLLEVLKIYYMIDHTIYVVGSMLINACNSQRDSKYKISGIVVLTAIIRDSKRFYISIKQRWTYFEIGNANGAKLNIISWSKHFKSTRKIDLFGNRYNYAIIEESHVTTNCNTRANNVEIKKLIEEHDLGLEEKISEYIFSATSMLSKVLPEVNSLLCRILKTGVVRQGKRIFLKDILSIESGCYQ